MLSRDEYQTLATGILNAQAKIVDGVPMVPMELVLKLIAAATEPVPTPRLKVIPIREGQANLELAIDWPTGAVPASTETAP